MFDAVVENMTRNGVVQLATEAERQVPATIFRADLAAALKIDPADLIGRRIRLIADAGTVLAAELIDDHIRG